MNVKDYFLFLGKKNAAMARHCENPITIMNHTDKRDEVIPISTGGFKSPKIAKFFKHYKKMYGRTREVIRGKKK